MKRLTRSRVALQMKHLAPGVYVPEIGPGPHPIVGVESTVTVFVGPARKGALTRTVEIRSFAEYTKTFGDLSPRLETGHAVRLFFLNGGRHAHVLRIAKSADAAQVRSAFRALDALDLLNLLVMPGNSDAAVLAQAEEYCRARRAMLVIDPPKSAQSPAAARAFVGSLKLKSGSNAVVYFPWPNTTDPATKRERAVPPGGAIAGIITRVDTEHGVWKAPANVVLAGVRSLGYAVSTAENEQLNSAGINCIRSFTGRGILVWGARAAGSSPEWKHLNVRRLLLFLEESIDRGTRWVVFEPNNQNLWADVRVNIECFLNTLWRAGAFQGAKPGEAFFVRCDRSTMTQADINEGRLNVEIGFAPVKPAEFVIFRIGQKTANSD